MNKLEKILRTPRSQAVMSIIGGVFAIALSIDMNNKVMHPDYLLTAIGVVAVIGGIIMLIILNKRGTNDGCSDI